VIAPDTPDELARAYGFSCYEALCARSQRLPMRDGKNWFIACAPNGRWFVWQDKTPIQVVAEMPTAGDPRGQLAAV
jgi:hypothetical protein